MQHEKLVRGNKSLSSETSQNQVRFTNLELRQLNGRFSEAEVLFFRVFFFFHLFLLCVLND